MAQQKDISLKQLQKYKLYKVTDSTYDFKNHKFIGQPNNNIVYRIDIPEEAYRFGMLDSFPFMPSDFPNLLELNICGASKEIPDFIDQFKNLIKLTCYSNFCKSQVWDDDICSYRLLPYVPENLWNLKNLKELHLDKIYYNLGDDILKLIKLEKLQLRVMNVDLAMLSTLPKLKTLDFIYIPNADYGYPSGSIFYSAEETIMLAKSLLKNRNINIYTNILADNSKNNAFVLDKKLKNKSKYKTELTIANNNVQQLSIIKDGKLLLKGYINQNRMDSVWTTYWSYEGYLKSRKYYKYGKPYGTSVLTGIPASEKDLYGPEYVIVNYFENPNSFSISFHQGLEDDKSIDSFVFKNTIPSFRCIEDKDSKTETQLNKFFYKDGLEKNYWNGKLYYCMNYSNGEVKEVICTDEESCKKFQNK